MQMYRSDETEFGMTMAHRAERESRCYRKHVGCALIADDNQECLSASCNRVPACRTDCREVCARARGESRLEDYSDCPAVHAEVSALTQLDRGLLKTPDGYRRFTACITAPPCTLCLYTLSSFPVSRIVYERRDHDSHVPEPSEDTRNCLGEIIQFTEIDLTQR